KLRTQLRCGFRDVRCPKGVHRCRELRIELTPVDIGIGRAEDDPIGTDVLDLGVHLFGNTDVCIAAAEAGNFVVLPYSQERFAQHAGGAEDEDSHGRKDNATSAILWNTASAKGKSTQIRTDRVRSRAVLECTALSAAIRPRRSDRGS